MQASVKIKDYETEILENLRGGEAGRGFFRCPNPDCRCDKFYRHGTYPRYFLTVGRPETEEAAMGSDGTDPFQTVHVRILRLICAGCGMTHAVLPSDGIPFVFETRDVFLVLVLHMSLAGQAAGKGGRVPVSSEGMFSWKVLRWIMDCYKKYRERMVCALRWAGLHQCAMDPDDVSLSRKYLGDPPQGDACRSFLLFHKKPPFVNRRGTASYPLRYVLPESLLN